MEEEERGSGLKIHLLGHELVSGKAYFVGDFDREL
jgi:hypothetical protein